MYIFVLLEKKYWTSLIVAEIINSVIYNDMTEFMISATMRDVQYFPP